MDELLQPGHALRIMRLARPLDEDGLHCMNFIQATRHRIFFVTLLSPWMLSPLLLSLHYMFFQFSGGPLWGPIS